MNFSIGWYNGDLQMALGILKLKSHQVYGDCVHLCWQSCVVGNMCINLFYISGPDSDLGYVIFNSWCHPGESWRIHRIYYWRSGYSIYMEVSKMSRMYCQCTVSLVPIAVSRTFSVRMNLLNRGTSSIASRGGGKSLFLHTNWGVESSLLIGYCYLHILM